MLKYNVVIIFIFLAILCEGCNSFNPDSETTIDSKVIFKIYEDHTSIGNNNIGKPEIHINFSTEKIYPCANYTLNLTKTVMLGNISINLISLEIPAICLTALGPATADLPLDLSSGKYKLNIKLNGIIDSYVITISDSVINISDYGSKLTSPMYERYYRYPPNSFAYYCGTTLDNKSICYNFLDTLNSEINIKEYHFPQDGQKPYPDSLGGYYYEMPVKFFIYNSDEDFNKIGNILSSYKKSVIKDKQGIGISIVNWENKYFYSWNY